MCVGKLRIILILLDAVVIKKPHEIVFVQRFRCCRSNETCTFSQIFHVEQAFLSFPRQELSLREQLTHLHTCRLNISTKTRPFSFLRTDFKMKIKCFTWYSFCFAPTFFRFWFQLRSIRMKIDENPRAERRKFLRTLKIIHSILVAFLWHRYIWVYFRIFTTS